MGSFNVSGIDFTLPAGPPLVAAPLSLLDETDILINLENLVASKREAVEKAASAAQQLDLIGSQEGDIPSEADAEEDAREAIAQQRSEWEAASTEAEENLRAAEAFASAMAEQVADLSRWEHGFQYLPELGNAESMEIFVPDSGSSKNDANNQDEFLWYDPFVAVSRDIRSGFGYSFTDYRSRCQRAERSLVNHEGWQCENEFWTGQKIPTNYHLTASPNTPTVSPHREITAWPNPLACPTTTLGTPVGLAQSLAALDQAIANLDAGTGMIHATPYVMQKWMQVYPFLRDSQGNVRTVNNNILVPGYGYTGTGPDLASRSVTDGVTTSGSNEVTSASAAFTDNDIGMPINETDTDGAIPAGSVITQVVSATEVMISNPAAASETGLHLTLPGVGGDATGSTLQWAYATEKVFRNNGDVHLYPADYREMSPDLPVNNEMPVRAERSHAFITNQLLRAAVLIDTTTV